MIAKCLHVRGVRKGALNRAGAQNVSKINLLGAHWDSNGST